MIKHTIIHDLYSIALFTLIDIKSFLIFLIFSLSSSPSSLLSSPSSLLSSPSSLLSSPSSLLSPPLRSKSQIPSPRLDKTLSESNRIIRSTILKRTDKMMGNNLNTLSTVILETLLSYNLTIP